MCVQNGLVDFQLNSGGKLKWGPLLLCHLASSSKGILDQFHGVDFDLSRFLRVLMRFSWRIPER